MAVPPFPVEQPYPTEINGEALDNYTQWFFLTYGITVTGLPAISVPCGFTRGGLPVGLQIVGRRRQEAAVLRAAAAFEAAAPWADRIPAVVSGRAKSREPGTKMAIRQPGNLATRERQIAGLTNCLIANARAESLALRGQTWYVRAPD